MFAGERWLLLLFPFPTITLSRCSAVQCWAVLLSSYTVCRKWLTVKRSKAVDRINILPWDFSPRGYTAPLPLLTDGLLPLLPQHSAHIVTTWCTDLQFRVWQGEGAIKRGAHVFICCLAVCSTFKMEGWSWKMILLLCCADTTISGGEGLSLC